ncbi:MAG: class I SAM-dependent methyltransferase [Stackebrandtia sp.]
MDKEYIFDTGSDLGREQMEYLADILDGPTTESLEAIDVRPGQRCLDLGAGGGSITRWLAERTGPTGAVVAVDLDTDCLVEQPGVEIHRHNVDDGLPSDGPYDLIHARLLLMHLSRREAILKTLVDALAPGGWLVVGDISSRPLKVLSAPSRADEVLFDYVQDVSHNVVARGRGVSFEWAHDVYGHMVDAGLTNVHGAEFSETNVGGDDACRLHRNYNLQAESLLLDAGLSADEIGRYRALLLDPRFRVWYYQFVCTRGQKPASHLHPNIDNL